MPGFQIGRIGLNGLEGFFVLFHAGQLEQILAIDDALVDVIEHQHHVFQGLLFLAQFLGMGGVVPDVRVFELLADFDQLFGLGIVVKDTSVVRALAPSGRRAGWIRS